MSRFSGSSLFVDETLCMSQDLLESVDDSTRYGSMFPSSSLEIVAKKDLSSYQCSA